MRATWKRGTRPALALLVLLLVAISVPAQAAAGSARSPLKRPGRAPSWPSDAVAGSLLVTTADGGYEHVTVPAGQESATAVALLGRGDVVDVEPDRLREPLRTPNDSRYAEQWAHELARTPAAWDLTTGSPTVEVAVIDSGIDGTHPALRPNLVRQVDLSSGTAQPVELGVDNDPCDVGHGTFVAGVLGAVGNDGADIAGVAWEVGIVDLAVSSQPNCLLTDSAIVAALRHAIDLGVDVVNLSLGAAGDSCPTAYQEAIDAARGAGIAVVAAAGNEEEDFPGATSVPASCNGVISVGAVGDTGRAASYSNTNGWIDVAAPGGDRSVGRTVLGLEPGGETTFSEGTSFAAPYVAGAIALMRSVNPLVTPDGIEAILEQTAVGTGTRSPATGWGGVDVGAAVTRAATPGPEPSPAPDPTFPVGLMSRVSAQDAVTTPVRQAVALSRFVFPDEQAQHAVLARSDDFADALAGSSLGFGVGPVLFSERDARLDPLTGEELARSLPPGATVYILGGTAALPASIENGLRSLGLAPRRIAGVNRQATASAVADEVVRRVTELGFPRPSRVLLATAHQWPDAVTAGSLGAWFGYPVLLTEAGRLSPEARAALDRLRPAELYVIGGTAAISDGVLTDAARASGGARTRRIAGRDRSETAVAVAERFIADFRHETDFDPLIAVAVNLGRRDGFAHVLSASSAIGAFSGIFLPLEGERGDVVPPGVAGVACSFSPLRGVAAGDDDLISDGAKEQLNALLEHRAC